VKQRKNVAGSNSL